jgi:Tfp pilus assembly protein PilF
MMARQDVGADHPNGWLALGLSTAALALLSSMTSLSNGFAYDDRWIIVENTRAHSLLHAWKFFNETYWPNAHGAALYRPLAVLLYAAEWTIGRGAPLVFHVVNVSLYVAVSVLVLWFALQCLPRGAAWVAAALFAVHPVHVEAVGNVVGQAELWTAVVMVGAVALYVRDRRAGLPLGRRTMCIIVALYVAGMLIKENAIVLPALIIAAEALLIDDRRDWRERAGSLRPLILWMGLFAAVFLWIRVRVTGDIGGDVMHPALMNRSMGERALVMLGLVPEFGRLFLWPARLASDYSPRQVPVYTEWNPELLPGMLLLLCLAILVLVSWRRAPVVAFGLAWFALAIAPVSNILIPTGILIAERTFLVPSVGLVISVAFVTPWMVDKLRREARVVRIAAAGLFAVLLTLGFARSAERQYTWKNSEAVFNALAVDAPVSFKAHYAAGGLYFEQKRPLEGEREWRYAIALMPGYYGVYADLGHKYREAHVCQAAIPAYQKALAIEPSLPLARVGMVACYLELAQWHRARAESRSAIADGFYRKAFEYMIERADSALMANDSLDATNRWTGHSKVLKP